MIFVTIGTQEPFDRLISAIDEIAPSLGDQLILAQVSTTSLTIKNMKTLEFIPPREFDRYFEEASLIISHAGMGTIITALTLNKPIIVMPRRASLGEHRNEHQLATATRFKEFNYIHVAFDEVELKTLILEIATQTKIEPLHQISQYASASLIASLRDFIKT